MSKPVWPNDWTETQKREARKKRQLESLKEAAQPNVGLQEQIRLLKLECSKLSKEALSQEMVRKEIIGLVTTDPEPPAWTYEASQHGKGTSGVPTLMCSDWHWGEVVDPRQINGCNEYNLEIAHKRAHRLISTTKSLLLDHMKNPSYPGIVMALAGDMFSGTIHDELTRTNEVPIMPTVIDLYEVLIECISEMADSFGRVFLPCVAGNHSRTTKKIEAKDFSYTNFDWLLYRMLQKYFEKDERIKFRIGDGPDVDYKLYGHRYCLTHGNEFRGGDGMIGPIGPITRGDHKKRGRNAQIDMPYDTLVLGHFHSLMQTRKLIMNGSLIGYNEYASNNSFGFELAQQALWLTHPEHGITLSMPVVVQDRAKPVETEWVSWRK